MGAGASVDGAGGTDAVCARLEAAGFGAQIDAFRKEGVTAADLAGALRDGELNALLTELGVTSRLARGRLAVAIEEALGGDSTVASGARPAALAGGDDDTTVMQGTATFVCASCGADVPERAHAECEGAVAVDLVAASEAEARAGQVVGRYALEEPLGEGGFGAVWRARGSGDERVALKILVLDLVRRGRDDAVMRVRRFWREGYFGALARHERLARALDMGQDGSGLVFLACELVPGVSLKEHMAAHGPLQGAALVRVGVQILAALQALHDVGVAHRDIKPANVVITPDGDVKVVDLGIAKRLKTSEDNGSDSGETSMTAAGFIGTPAYMAPERMQPHAMVTAAGDIFAVGITLIELALGKRPRTNELPIAQLQATGWPFVDVLLRACAPVVAERYQTAAEMIAALPSVSRPAQEPAAVERAPEPAPEPKAKPAPEPEPEQQPAEPEPEQQPAEPGPQQEPHRPVNVATPQITDQLPHLPIALIGVEGAGKSTLAGHLLFKLGLATEDALRAAAGNGGGSFSLAMLKTRAEWEFPMASRHVSSAVLPLQHRFVSLVDTPGGHRWVKNALMGYAMAAQGAGLVVVSARRGQFEEHEGEARGQLRAATALGIAQVVVAVTKMDDASVTYSQERFDEIKEAVHHMLQRAGVNTSKRVYYVPVSGQHGDNLAPDPNSSSGSNNMPWYHGPSLLELLDEALETPKWHPERPLQLALTSVDKVSGVGSVFSGVVLQGSFTPGATLTLPSGEQRRVTSVESHFHSVDVATPGMEVGVVMHPNATKPAARRGDVIRGVDAPAWPRVIVAQLIFIPQRRVQSQRVFKKGVTMVVHAGTAAVTCRIRAFRSMIDSRSGRVLEEEPQAVQAGTAAIAELEAVSNKKQLVVDSEGPLSRLLLRMVDVSNSDLSQELVGVGRVLADPAGAGQYV